MGQHQTRGSGAGSEHRVQTAAGPEAVDMFCQCNSRRADVGAGAALGAQVGEVGAFSYIRSQEDTDGAGINSAVEMPAAQLKYGADIQTGPATQADTRLREIWGRQPNGGGHCPR